jgi:hypothetical protein
MNRESEAALLDRLEGEQMIHRLRDWADGDTLWGVRSWNSSNGYTSHMGKTFTDDEYGTTGKAAASSEFDKYVQGPLASDSSDVVLFRATVRNPQTESRPSSDPEPPLKYGDLEDVEIIRRSPPADE